MRAGVSLAALVLALGLAEVGLWIAGYPSPPMKRPVFVDENMRPIVRGRDNALFGRENANAFIDYELKPGTRAYQCFSAPYPAGADAQGRVEILINDHGLRDHAIAPAAAAGTRRILCLGDSFTFGNAVAATATYPKQLERILRAEGYTTDVVNCGFAAGPRIPNHVAYLMTRGVELAPDTAIITVCLNDIGDVPMDLRELVDFQLPGRDCLRIVRLLEFSIERVLIGSVNDPDRLFADRMPEKSQRYWKESILVARDWCREQKINLLVVIYPMMVELDGTYPWSRFHEVVVEHCEKEGVAVCDLLPAFRGRDARSLWAHPTDQHPGPEGHAIAARAIAGALTARGWK
jgi:lysophospholipase L1-like esterase